eukprot:CAMPEP_0174273158 /NCGR_PEP_ID=MMETSP0439-20130205/53595_1 /TAXON_ID=0 /ORGANISM="Stereomyxa ramosa, Strain Chinc5" /LENGTH=376 /DNA_ID=CAMNT_0015364135 /DNA_START=228 /DNA_END=1358 /DNA_ORIENTATION=+
MKRGTILWGEKAANTGITAKGVVYSVKIIAYDDESNATLAALLYEQMIPEVDFFLGPYATSITEAVVQVTEANNKLLVFGNGAGEDLFRKGYQLCFGVGTTANHYTTSAVIEYMSNGADTANYIYLAGPSFTESVKNGLVNILLASGMEIYGNETLAFSDTDDELREKLTTLRDQGAELFFGIVFFSQAESIVTIARDIGFNPKGFYLTSAPGNPQFVDDLGDAVFNIAGPVQWHPDLNYADDFFGSAGDYASAYLEKFGEEASFISAQSSIAGYVLQRAIEMTDSENIITDQSLLAVTLRKMELDTFYGPIGFDSYGNNRKKPMVTIQIQEKDGEGEIRVVAPEPHDTHDLIYESSGCSSLFSSSLVSYLLAFLA